MTTTTHQLSDDDRRALALAAVICNDTTLLSEWNGDVEADLAQRRAAVGTAFRQDVRHWLARGVRRLLHAMGAPYRTVDTTQL